METVKNVAATSFSWFFMTLWALVGVGYVFNLVDLFQGEGDRIISAIGLIIPPLGSILGWIRAFA